MSKHKETLHQGTRIDIAIADRPPRILVLEDEESVQKLVGAMLKIRGFTCDSASTVSAARELMRRTPYDVVLADVHLPDGSGLDLIKETVAGDPLLIVITGSSDIQTAVQAIRNGAIDFITKPFTVGDFLQRIDHAMEEWKSRERLKGYAEALERLVDMKSEDLSRSSQQIDDVHDKTVFALGAALNLKDHETSDHCGRVALNCTTLGSMLGLSDFELKNLKWGAHLHDVGKIGIPESILLKPGALSPEERVIMEKHPLMGYTMLRNIEFLKFATDVVLSHHERFDGKGYPNGLKGEGIPLHARIFSIMDTLDAMTSNRPYRAALPLSAALAEIRKQSGSQFDPEITEVFIKAPLSTWHVQDPVSIRT